MNEDSELLDRAGRMLELLNEGTEGELRLLKQERKAEKRLATALAAFADDETRLEKTKRRLDRSREAVLAAKAALHEAQARRAAGPDVGQD